MNTDALITEALALSLAESALAVRMRSDDEACPECYIAGSVEAFRRQHEAEREDMIALRAEVAALTAALEELERKMLSRDAEYSGAEVARCLAALRTPGAEK